MVGGELNRRISLKKKKELGGRFALENLSIIEGPDQIMEGGQNSAVELQRISRTLLKYY